MKLLYSETTCTKWGKRTGVGASVGIDEGAAVGILDGLGVGVDDGVEVGTVVGSIVGASVGIGARMLRGLLRQEGFSIGRKRVARLMKRMGVEALYRKPRTTKPAPGHKIYPYLLRHLPVERANQVWAMDITYLPMAKGFVYRRVEVDLIPISGPSRCPAIRRHLSMASCMSQADWSGVPRKVMTITPRTKPFGVCTSVYKNKYLI